MITGNRCEKCNAIRANIKDKCSFCEANKFGSAAKRLFGGLFSDAKTFVADKTNQLKKVRIKVEE